MSDTSRSVSREWIPTNERMPETREYVIGWYQPGIAVRIVCFWADTQLWHEHQASRFDPIHRKYITHWMPLPAAPDRAKPHEER